MSSDEPQSAPHPATTTTTFDAVWADMCEFEGWLSEEQARRLWNAAQRLSAPARIVEIGSYRGRSTTVLARGASRGVELVALDPHVDIRLRPDDANLAAFRSNLRRAGADATVRHVRKRSQDALDDVEGHIDLLFVDGDHRFGPALDDIVRWGGRVRHGGTMFLHDSFNAVGLTLAQLRALVFGSRFRYIGRWGSLSEYRREDLTGREHLVNTARQLLQLGYTAHSNAVKVALRLRLVPIARLLGHRSDIGPY